MVLMTTFEVLGKEWPFPDLVNQDGTLTRHGRYRLAANADVDARVVDSEWAAWCKGEQPASRTRERIRRVAREMGLVPLQAAERGGGDRDGKATGPEAA